MTSLTSLQHLAMGQNLFSGSLPVTLQSLTALRSFTVDQNRLEGTVNNGVSWLSSLVYLSVFENPSLDWSLELLGHYPLLQQALMQKCNIGGNLPEQLPLASSLQTLLLNDNRLRGTIPETLLAGLTSLHTLALSNNQQLSGTLPTALAQLPGLAELLAHGMRLSGSIPAGWSGALVAELRTVSLARNFLRGQTGVLNSLNLTTLLLSGNYLSAEAATMNEASALATGTFTEPGDYSLQVIGAEISDASTVVIDFSVDLGSFSFDKEIRLVGVNPFANLQPAVYQNVIILALNKFLTGGLADGPCIFR